MNDLYAGHPWNSILQELKRLVAQEAATRTLREISIHASNRPVCEIPIEQLMKEVGLRWQEYDSEIDRTIAAWKLGGKFEAIEPHAHNARFVRIQTALSFVSLILIPNDSSAVFPRPRTNDEDSIRWLLTVWWKIRGIQFRAMLEKTIWPKAGEQSM